MANVADVILLADRESTLWRLGGRCLAGRLAAQCLHLGVAKVRLLASPELLPRLTPEGATLLSCMTDDPSAACAGLADSQLVLALPANCVADERLLADALGRERCLVYAGRGGIEAAVVPAGELRRHGLDLFECSGQLRGAERVEIADLPRFWPAQRRTLTQYCLAVTDRDDLEHARRTVLNAAGKGHQEWTVPLFNRPVETAISRILVETRISPNAITVLSLATGLAGAMLIAAGALAWALAACLASVILDGLDGRQARVQIRFSRYGEFEHAADKVVEFAWIAALGWHLSGGHLQSAEFAGAVLWIVLVNLDNLSGSLHRKRTGFLPELATPFDAAIRFVAPRRNTNLAYLALGGLLGRLLAAYWIVIAASALVVVLHWVRVAYLLRSGPRRPWLARSARPGTLPAMLFDVAAPAAPPGSELPKAGTAPCRP